MREAGLVSTGGSPSSGWFPEGLVSPRCSRPPRKKPLVGSDLALSSSGVCVSVAALQVAEPLTRWTSDQHVKSWLLHRDTCHQHAYGFLGSPARLLKSRSRVVESHTFILDVFEIHKSSITGHIFLCLVILCGMFVRFIHIIFKLIFIMIRHT